MEDRPFLMYDIAKEATCKIVIHHNDVGAVSYGIALQKNSTWRLPVSEAISYLEEEGILENLEKKWLNFDCPQSTQKEFSTFELTFFATPIALLFGVCWVSTFVLLLELCYCKCTRYKKFKFKCSMS